MAKRVSGNISVRLTYLDEDNVYKCRLSCTVERKR